MQKLPSLLHLRGPSYVTKTNHLPMDISRLSDIFLCFKVKSNYKVEVGSFRTRMVSSYFERSRNLTACLRPPLRAAPRSAPGCFSLFLALVPKRPRFTQ